MGKQFFKIINLINQFRFNNLIVIEIQALMMIMICHKISISYQYIKD